MEQVRYFVVSDRDHEYALRLESTDGEVREILLETRLNTRVGLLDRLTLIDENVERRFRRSGVRELEDAERARVHAAYRAYLETIPETKRFRSLTYQVKDIVGRQGFGIGSAGLPAYNVGGGSHPGPGERRGALDEAGQRCGPEPDRARRAHQGILQAQRTRTAVAPSALQAHADPWLGYTEIDDVGFVVTELSFYVEDLDWSDLTEPEQMSPVLDYLGRATAKVHCVADKDSDPNIVGFQTEDEIIEVLSGNEEEFVQEMVEFGASYSEVARDDHRLFVDAFRNGRSRAFNRKLSANPSRRYKEISRYVEPEGIEQQERPHQKHCARDKTNHPRAYPCEEG